MLYPIYRKLRNVSVMMRQLVFRNMLEAVAMARANTGQRRCP